LTHGVDPAGLQAGRSQHLATGVLICLFQRWQRYYQLAKQDAISKVSGSGTYK